MRGYNLLWRLARPAVPLLLARRAAAGKEDENRLGERYGRYEHRNDLPDKPIWIHAVSVGETVAGIALAEAFRTAGETAPILLTTNTATAAERVAGLPSSLGVTHLYQPLDHPRMAAAFLRRLRPRIGIFLESDFWPNLITATAASGAPVAFVSAQLSDRAARRWQRNRRTARAMFGTARLVLAVDQIQAAKMISLGANKAAVRVGGSLKLPAAGAAPDKELLAMLRNVANGRRVLLAASTHEGEDEAAIAASQALGPDWFTIIAPRHPNRGADIARLCDSAGIAAAQRSAGARASLGDAIYIADTLGEMDSLFSASDIAFLGGSLTPLGGHNPVEPAAYGLPVLTGPHIFKNSAEFSALSAVGVVKQVTDGAGLAKAAEAICGDEARLAAVAAAARAHAAEAGKRPANAAQLCLALMRDG